MRNEVNIGKPSIYSGISTDGKALFSILQDYNLFIYDALVTFTNAFFLRRSRRKTNSRGIILIDYNIIKTTQLLCRKVVSKR